MNHRMAIGTNRPKIPDWVEQIRLTNACKWNKVMNVDEIFSTLAINFFKIKFTDKTSITIVIDTSLAPQNTSFVGIDRHLLYGTLYQIRRNFIRIRDIAKSPRLQQSRLINPCLREPPTPPAGWGEIVPLIKPSSSPLNHVVPIGLRSFVRQYSLSRLSSLQFRETEIIRKWSVRVHRTHLILFTMFEDKFEQRKFKLVSTRIGHR